VNNLTNPGSTSPSSSFSLASYLAGYLIENITSGVAINGLKPNSFTVVSLTPNNSINGNSSTYLLQFQSSIDYVAGSILILSLPSQVNLSSIPSCVAQQNITVTCTIIGGNLHIVVAQALLHAQVYSLSISTFTNPRTYTQSGSFNLTSYIYNLAALIDSSLISGLINTQPNIIKSITMSVIIPTQSYMASNQSSLFSVTTTNSLANTDYI
jgi:hypothetical protein